MRGLTYSVLLSIFSTCLCWGQGVTGYIPPERHVQTLPTFIDQTARPLRYQPEDTDFVIENGEEFYNRPLYGANTNFRCDAGDKPELSLYMRGRGGNIRFAIQTGQAVQWLHDCQQITTRYRPGCMIYEIRDPILGTGRLHLTVQSLFACDGILARLEAEDLPTPLTSIVAYGGANGMRCRRNGDIGCEKQPVAQLFQLQVDQCTGDAYQLQDSYFRVQSPRQQLYGVFESDAELTLADACYWNDLPALLRSDHRVPEAPILIAQASLRSGEPQYFAIQRVQDDFEPLSARDLADLYIDTERERRLRAHQVRVDTPDPFINAACAALCMAADAVWDEPTGTVMHGGVAWRSKLLGWRGPYANDVLGRHDRARRHFTYWAGQQVTTPIPDHILPADPKAHLARNEPSLHSNGALSKSHYDMNLVYIDGLLRHLLWTGDLDLARELWPVIERHLAWERRLFRRPFGPDGQPLYEAYAAIWASDDLQYHGGGVTHTSAYNLWHNRMAARLARLLGMDATAYQQEADAIAQAMTDHLWLDQDGWYAEWKDLLGLQQVHPQAGLWTFYHSLDSHAADPWQAWQMTRYVDTQIAHIPIHGPGVPEEGLYTLPSTSWMPYTWSTNNVVMAEVAHTSLGFWQAGRPEEAFKMFKGCVLDSMFLGRCPGNAGMCTYFDMARGETQRDFADAAAMGSRALVEGLFGIRPDLLAGTLNLQPGWPQDWQRARIMHPEIDFTYQRDDLIETYTIKPKFSQPVTTLLTLPALRDRVAAVTLNGKPVDWQCQDDAIGKPHITLQVPDARRSEVRIVWQGQPPIRPTVPEVLARDARVQVKTGPGQLLAWQDPQRALNACRLESGQLSARVTGKCGPRTVFVQLHQGDMTWWAPLALEIRPAYEILDPGKQRPGTLRFILRNNTHQSVQEKATVRLAQATHTRVLDVPAHGIQTLELPTPELLPGTQRIRMQWPKADPVMGEVTHWRLTVPNSDLGASVDIPTNAQLKAIFQQEYLEPRSPYCSLAIPKQGIGSWCHYNATCEVNEVGIKRAAALNQGRFTLPNGVPFTLSNEDADILFVSQWNNHPNEVTLPLEGVARHLYLFMAGTTNSMQSQFDNGEVIVTYTDDSTERLPLRNPTTWWPIDQDYFIDDYGFKRPEAAPPRVNLKTGKVRVWDAKDFTHKNAKIDGGAGTVLDLPLNDDKTLKSMTIRALANEVIIGLLAATLVQ